MRKFLISEKHAFSTSKLINLLAICITSFLLSVSSDALLFNPFILSTIWFSYRFSPLYRNTYLLSLLVFTSFISLNYGIEILLIIIFLTLSNYILFFLKKKQSNYAYLPLLLLLVLIGYRYISFNYSISSILNSIFNTLLTMLLSISLEKLRFSCENPGERLENEYKIICISFIYALFLPFDVINLFSIGLITLFLIRYEKSEVVIASLLTLLIYNYLFFNISFDVLIIYIISLLITVFINFYKPIIFAILISLFYIAKYDLFYMDINFYLNFILIGFYYVLPDKLVYPLNKIFNNENDLVSHLEQEISNKNKKEERAKEYLLFALQDPFDEKNVIDELTNNIKKGICHSCPKKSKCNQENRINSYLEESINKNEKQIILEECYYPYKLLKRIENGRKNYHFQEISKCEKKMNREVFNVQLELILNAFEEQNENKYFDNKYYIDYQVFSEGVNEVNGDSYLFIEDKNRHLVLLSDGMGHNRYSHQISSYLVNLFFLAYRLNRDIKKVLSNLNLLLKVKSTSENFATIDLASFDLYQGNITLFKAGSFSSFLIRDNNLVVFNKISPPLGILDKLEIYQEEYSIKDGDIWIFLSDGFDSEVDGQIRSSIELLKRSSFESYSKKLFDLLKNKDVIDDKTLIVIKVGLI